MGTSGHDGSIEPHILLKDYRHGKVFVKYETLHEEQPSWPIHTKARARFTVGTTGHDKAYHNIITNEMEPLGARQPQYHVQDMEPNNFDTFVLNQGGFIQFDLPPQLSTFDSKQWMMDQDWLTYREGPSQFQAVENVVTPELLVGRKRIRAAPVEARATGVPQPQFRRRETEAQLLRSQGGRRRRRRRRRDPRFAF